MKFVKSLLTLGLALGVSTSVLAESSTLSSLKDSATSSIKSSATDSLSSAKSSVTDKVTSAKTTATDKVSAAKTSASDKVSTAKTSASDKVSAAKTSANDKVNSAKSAASSTTSVNINTATAKQLQQLDGIGATKAKAIVAYRKKNGSFTSVEQLKNVSGIGDTIINDNKSRITLK